MCIRDSLNSTLSICFSPILFCFPYPAPQFYKLPASYALPDIRLHLPDDTCLLYTSRVISWFAILETPPKPVFSSPVLMESPTNISYLLLILIPAYRSPATMVLIRSTDMKISWIINTLLFSRKPSTYPWKMSFFLIYIPISMCISCLLYTSLHIICHLLSIE